MVTPLHTTFLPLPFDASIDEHRIEGALGVRSLIRELIDARGLISMFAADSTDDFVVTRVLTVDGDDVEFDFNTDPQREQALLAASHLVVVGLPGSVKIQLRLTSFEVRPAEAGRPKVLVARVPGEGWRIQRRNAFRVAPPGHDKATVVIRNPDGGELPCPMIDLSVGGLAAWLPDGQAVAPDGTLWRHCRIEAHGIAPIPCDLKLVRSDKPAPGGRIRLCCEYEKLPSESARRVQLYVIDIETRSRRLR